MELSKVIIKPLTTEKSVSLAEQNQYVFMVAKESNKIEVMQAIKAFYGVKPVSCQITKVPKKSNSKRLKRKPYNKAVVRFAKDSKFDPNKF